MNSDIDLIENYFIDTEESVNDNIKYLILVIYDVSSNKKRYKLSKYLQSFGFRVQKSAFEAVLNKKLYEKFIKNIKKYIEDEDNVRIYKLRGAGEVLVFGNSEKTNDNDFIII